MSAFLMKRNSSTARTGFRSAILSTAMLAALAAFPFPLMAQPAAGPVEGSPFGASRNARAIEGEAIFPGYRLRDGSRLDAARIHYWTMGKPTRDANGLIDNAVLVLHWTGASGAAMLGPAWDDALFGPGKPLDSNRYYLIFPDNLGHGQSSKPSDGLHGRFPRYGYEDLVDLQHRLVTEKLGVGHLRLLLGMSMGGMNAWQWAERYPAMMDGVVSLAAIPSRISGRNLLWRQIVVDQIRSDPEWAGGDYRSQPGGWMRAFPFLRMMIGNIDGLATAVPDRATGAAFLAQSHKQAQQTDANDVAYALDASTIDYDPEAGIGKIAAPFLSINFADDELYPDAARQVERFRPLNANIRYAILDNGARGAGHLSVTRPELWKDHLEAFIAQTRASPGDRTPARATGKSDRLENMNLLGSSDLDPAAVRRVAEGFIKDLENLNLAGVMSRMSPSTLLFFPPQYENGVPVGLEAIEASWSRVFARIRQQSKRTAAPFIRIVPHDLRISTSGDTAVVTFTFPAPDGSAGRRTLVLRPENGRLVVAHLHGSSDR